LGPNVFEELSKKIKGKDGEIWLTDAVARLIEAKKTVIAPPWSGSLVASTGDPMGWLKSNILFAINDDRYRDELRSFVKNIEFDV
jgi:UTP--glucose-1-phosphate uridylyltransferase